MAISSLVASVLVVMASASRPILIIRSLSVSIPNGPVASIDRAEDIGVECGNLANSRDRAPSLTAPTPNAYRYNPSYRILPLVSAHALMRLAIASSSCGIHPLYPRASNDPLPHSTDFITIAAYFSTSD